MEKLSGVVTFTTDFGLRDPFVGLLQAVLQTRAPAARVIHLTHDIPPQDIAGAAFWIDRSFEYLPEGTVHVVVVDPGVGSARRALVACVDRHYFIGPDNGVLAPILDRGKSVEVRRINRARLDVDKVSKTFHGRDIFAPAAAELVSGRLWLTELGVPLDAPYTPAVVAPPTVNADGVNGAIVVIDHFGNLISNISSTALAKVPDPVVTVEEQTFDVVTTYADLGLGTPGALINGFDRLEIAVRNRNAAAQLGVCRGAAVSVASREK